MRTDRYAHVTAQKPAATFDIAPRPPQCTGRHRTLRPVGETRIERSRRPSPEAWLHYAFERMGQLVGSKDADMRLLRFITPLRNLLPSAYEFEMKLSGSV
jgi:hypothetical protein